MVSVFNVVYMQNSKTEFPYIRASIAIEKRKTTKKDNVIDDIIKKVQRHDDLIKVDNFYLCVSMCLPHCAMGWSAFLGYTLFCDVEINDLYTERNF